MASNPLVSFIVLSYNYERYIATTLRSILGQTVEDLEVVVVDDASKDRSCEVVEGFHDPRVRLHRNETNLGGAGSYNRAISLARGEFLVNLDADDWIDPRKTEIQLKEFERDPSLDIIGTHVVFVDGDGATLELPEFVRLVNAAHDFNQIDTWTVQNMLCRSSTMMRRSVHERIGPDDPSMVRCPDFELWTRALRLGCRFGLVPVPLTYSRMHTGGVTHGNPAGAYRETCFLLLKNLLPLVEQRAAYPSLARILDWVTAHEQFACMRPIERYRLLGWFLETPSLSDFEAFSKALASDVDDAAVGRGRRYLSLRLTGGDRILDPQLDRYLQLRYAFATNTELLLRKVHRLPLVAPLGRLGRKFAPLGRRAAASLRKSRRGAGP